MNIRNGQSSSPICTKRCVWLVNSLLEPTNELAPDVLAIVFFLTCMGHLSLAFLIHLRVRIVLYVASADDDLISTLLAVIFVTLSEIGFSVGIHNQDVTKGGNLNFITINTP
jgi:hypothetical protein